MANINDYMIIIKEINKAYDSLSPLIGPNINEDIQTINKSIKAFKYNILYVKSNIHKTNRILRLKRHNRKKKNFVK